jgi:hypothetical protein
LTQVLDDEANSYQYGVGRIGEVLENVGTDATVYGYAGDWNDGYNAAGSGQEDSFWWRTDSSGKTESPNEDNTSVSFASVMHLVWLHRSGKRKGTIQFIRREAVTVLSYV